VLFGASSTQRRSEDGISEGGRISAIILHLSNLSRALSPANPTTINRTNDGRPHDL
jgi:hypothetical protein